MSRVRERPLDAPDALHQPDWQDEDDGAPRREVRTYVLSRRERLTDPATGRAHDGPCTVIVTEGPDGHLTWQHLSWPACDPENDG